LELISSEEKILQVLLNVITTCNRNLNVTEALYFLISVVKLVIEHNIDTPTPVLVDEVKTEKVAEYHDYKLGDVIKNNLSNILIHFDIEKDIEENKKIEGTYGDTYTPLGFKRYIIL